MSEIQVGEYVRTIRGEIGIFEKYSSRKETSIYKSNFDHFIILQGRKTHLQCDKSYIVKHSKNIIDLIEERRLCEWLSSKKNTEFLQCSVQF